MENRIYIGYLNEIHAHLKSNLRHLLLPNLFLCFTGLPPDDYDLVSVTVLIRHGNRLPMPDTVPIGPMSIPRVSCKLDTSNSAIPDTLQKFIGKNMITL